MPANESSRPEKSLTTLLNAHACLEDIIATAMNTVERGEPGITGAGTIMRNGHAITVAAGGTISVSVDDRNYHAEPSFDAPYDTPFAETHAFHELPSSKPSTLRIFAQGLRPASPRAQHSDRQTGDPSGEIRYDGTTITTTIPQIPPISNTATTGPHLLNTVR